MTTRRYGWLAGSLFGAMALRTINQYWAGDFLEHAAVIRELARHPWAPGHPLFAIQAPHPFFTPYTVGVALIARAFQLHPVTVLSVMGMVNLAAFLVSFYLLTSTLLSRHAAFFGLIFTLLLWGRSPWQHSGFLHLNVMGFVLPYPSTFAMWMTLFILYAQLRYNEAGASKWAVLVVIGAPIVLLSHPITAIVLAAGLVTFSLESALSQPGRLIRWGTVVAVASLVAAALWPFYPWFQLIATGSETYAQPNLKMYEGVLPRVWPALLGVPLVVRRLRKQKFDRLSLFVIALCLLYGLGAILGNGPLGRVLAALVLGLHLVLADALADIESGLQLAVSRTTRLSLYAGAAVLAGVALLNATSALVRAIPRGLLPRSIADDPRLERTLDLYRFVPRYVGEDDVVLADLNVGRYLPALAGKVVAFIDPEAFVPDHDTRRMAVHRFFLGDISTDERRTLVDTYHAAWVVIDLKSNSLTAAVLTSIEQLGSVVHDDGRIRVFRLKQTTAAPREERR